MKGWKELLEQQKIELFKGDESKYKSFVDIIEERFERMLNLDLHGAAYWLNPAFQYDPELKNKIPRGAFNGLLKIIEDYYADPKILEEITIFREGDRKSVV